MKTTLGPSAILLTIVAFEVLASGRGHVSPARSPVAPAIDKVIHVSAFVAVSPTNTFAYFSANDLLRR
jgi:hypothetical protein